MYNVHIYRHMYYVGMDEVFLPLPSLSLCSLSPSFLSLFPLHVLPHLLLSLSLALPPLLPLPLPLSLSPSTSPPLSSSKAAGGTIQQRLQAVWSRLHFTMQQSMEMAIKYSSHQYKPHTRKVCHTSGMQIFTTQFACIHTYLSAKVFLCYHIVHDPINTIQALNLWENVCNMIEEREGQLEELQIFENTASDPSRFFTKGVHTCTYHTVPILGHIYRLTLGIFY